MPTWGEAVVDPGDASTEGRVRGVLGRPDMSARIRKREAFGYPRSTMHKAVLRLAFFAGSARSPPAARPAAPTTETGGDAPPCPTPRPRRRAGRRRVRAARGCHAARRGRRRRSATAPPTSRPTASRCTSTAPASTPTSPTKIDRAREQAVHAGRPVLERRRRASRGSSILPAGRQDRHHELRRVDLPERHEGLEGVQGRRQAHRDAPVLQERWARGTTPTYRWNDAETDAVRKDNGEKVTDPRPRPPSTRSRTRASATTATPAETESAARRRGRAASGSRPRRA